MNAWAFPSLADYYDDNRDRLVVLPDAPPEVITSSRASPSQQWACVEMNYRPHAYEATNVSVVLAVGCR